MIDLRYHVYSLAAVFFALAIGIVIGTSFVGKPADREQMLRITNRYERDMKTMQEEMRKQLLELRRVKADYNRSEKTCQTLIPAALKDKLLYHNVAIIQTGEYDELTADLYTTIQSVGGLVTSVTKISPSFDFEDPDSVTEALTAAEIVPNQDESGRAAILRTIAEAVINARNTEKLPVLEEKNVINSSGDYTRWNRHVLIIGGSASGNSHRAEVIDLPLLDQLRGLNTTIVACEPFGATSSCVTVWKKVDIATVDNADNSCGRIAIICALAGEKAHYGQKRTAERLLPELPGVKRE